MKKPRQSKSGLVLPARQGAVALFRFTRRAQASDFDNRALCMKCSCRKFGRAGSFCLSLRCCTVTRSARRLQCLTPAKADLGEPPGRLICRPYLRARCCGSDIPRDAVLFAFAGRFWPPLTKTSIGLPQFRDLPRVPMPPNWSTRYLLGLIRPGPAFSGYLRIAGQMRSNAIWLVWGSVFHAWQVQNFRR